MQEIVAERHTLLSSPQRCPTAEISATRNTLLQHTENKRGVADVSLDLSHTE